MSKIVFDLDDFKKFLKIFDELIVPRVAGGGTYGSEKILYEIDDYGRIYSKRFINNILNDSKFEEFIQGQIVNDLNDTRLKESAREKS
ncbi:MAG: hypothetical protein JSV62_07495 [Promethearchaeota archaeon]|nr:MAG: hypothetical protein JSV62_07495 [Candidatus Lokiarchaeota archaeon]